MLTALFNLEERYEKVFCELRKCPGFIKDFTKCKIQILHFYYLSMKALNSF